MTRPAALSRRRPSCYRRTLVLAGTAALSYGGHRRVLDNERAKPGYYPAAAAAAAAVGAGCVEVTHRTPTP